jgi:hypothetical protein
VQWQFLSETRDNRALQQFNSYRIAGTVCKIYVMKQHSNSQLKGKAWIAILALLLQALLPSVIYAAAPKGSDLSEICTAFGIRKVATASGDSTGTTSHSQHCPVCSVAHLFALPPTQLWLHSPSRVAFDAPRPALSQEYPASRLSPYLRGPPVHL